MSKSVSEVVLTELKAMGHDISAIIKTANYYANYAKKNAGDTGRHDSLLFWAIFLAIFLAFLQLEKVSRRTE